MIKSNIKTKWILFILLLLIGTMVLTSTIILSEVLKYQEKIYENTLLEYSRNANLYIREKYNSVNHTNYEDFYLENADILLNNLDTMIPLSTKLYDKNGNQLSSNTNLKNSEDRTVLLISLEGYPSYRKDGHRITYCAPIYDFDDQIGVIEIFYNVERELQFFNDIKIKFLIVGALAILISFIIGSIYFGKIAEQILDLKYYVGNIGRGNYEVKNNSVFLGDELYDLKLGIDDMAKTIEGNISHMNLEKEKLKATLNRLRNLENQQKEFISNVSHEFKTPITVLKAQLDLVDLYRDDESLITNSIDIFNKELHRLNKMVEKVLELSKLERYEFEFNKTIINSRLMLLDIYERIEPKAKKYNISIDLKLEDANIHVDPDSLIQIFINILDNAIKYNINGGTIYVCSYIEEGYNKIEVANTGVKIPLEEQDRVFEPFYTIEQDKQASDFSTTGLGLPLTKKLIESQNGNIKLIEKQNLTCFKVSFPIVDDNIK